MGMSDIVGIAGDHGDRAARSVNKRGCRGTEDKVGESSSTSLAHHEEPSVGLFTVQRPARVAFDHLAVEAVLVDTEFCTCLRHGLFRNRGGLRTERLEIEATPAEHHRSIDRCLP